MSQAMQRFNLDRRIENGTEAKEEAAGAWVGVALEADGLLVLHEAGDAEAGAAV